VRAYVDSDRVRWDEYVRRSDRSHFGQLTNWKDFVEETYPVRSCYFLDEDGAGIRGILPLFRKRGFHSRLFSAPGGLLADDESIAEALLAPARALLKKERLEMIELRDQTRAWPGLLTNRQHVTLVLDLMDTVEEQWKSFDTSLRTKIRKGQKAGLDPCWDRHRVEDFYRVMLENMRNLGTPIRNARYFRKAMACLGRAGDLLILSRRGKPVGGLLTVGHGETLINPLGSCRKKYLGIRSNELLYWEALKYAVERGFKHFDFGRSQWNSGTFVFKRKWGANPVQLYYQYILGRGTRPPAFEDQLQRYHLLAEIWKRLPLFAVGFLGEPARKRFPELA
jgi:FemAB-related protein (PEP-CTERM system-associated)